MITRIFLVIMLLAAQGTAAQDVARVVYLGIADDPHYEPRPVYTGLSLRDRTRPLDGARVAMRESRILGRVLGVEFALEEMLVAPGEAAEAARVAFAEGALGILLDLPADELAAIVVPQAAGLAINIRDRDDRWRGADCKPGLLHTVPSTAMLADALAQHLRARGWERILLLSGDHAADAGEADAVRRAAGKFGLTLAADRAFQLTNDPRRRDLSNIALLTGDARYDVIWLVDNDGEFGRYLPFATYLPRPVVGAEGLRPLAWHWTFERYGAPQLNQRFRRIADRDMTSEDWAAWAAVRALVEGVQRVGSADPARVAAFVRSDEMALDLYKGTAGSFRDWNGQLRQPLLLATHNAVIARAPIDGFEHRIDTLDTLGVDAPETACDQ
ncbi:amino acid ABC transporter substrate-binding protein [Rhodobacteraceae bacterium 2CG4]|uniref:Amino acid ABC transporter substrate-binding protein n=1 Tax=Halovulum marinum TaxID=2662447 RepID=A0A6L5Z188_9RHOB|nr:amino acid ABC transporter substrate-binding protein [Halovulum marinum]MSU90268.1 amino acid ABC transporter substrate-binding protein [Halovulum marinum]